MELDRVGAATRELSIGLSLAPIWQLVQAWWSSSAGALVRGAQFIPPAIFNSLETRVTVYEYIQSLI